MYGIVIQFTKEINGSLLDYILEDVMKCEDVEGDGEYDYGSDGMSVRYFDERHTTIGNCRASFRRLKKFISINEKFWMDKIVYADIQFINKRTADRDNGYKTGLEKYLNKK